VGRAAGLIAFACLLGDNVEALRQGGVLVARVAVADGALEQADQVVPVQRAGWLRQVRAGKKAGEREGGSKRGEGVRARTEAQQ